MAITSDTVANEAGATVKVYEKALDGLKQSAAKAAAGFEHAQANIAQDLETSQTSASNALVFGQQTWAAYARSTQIWVAGLHDIARQSATVALASAAEAREHLKELMAAKSVKEAVEKQTRNVQAFAEKSVAEGSRLATAYARLAEAALAPISARIRTAAEPAPQGQASPAAFQP